MEILGQIMGVSWTTPIYITAIYGAIRYFSNPKNKQKPGLVNWSPLESITVTLAIYFGAQILGVALVYIYPLLNGWSETTTLDWFESSVYAQFAVVVFVNLLTAWLLYLFLLRRQATFRTIGLIGKPGFKDLGYALVAYGIYFVAYLVILGLLNGVIPSLDVEQEQQIGFKNAEGPLLALVFVSLVLLPAIVEELVARGFLYSGLKRRLPKLYAVLITSSLFGIAHLQVGSGAPLLWVAALDTFLLSLFLIYLKDRTGKLWAPMGLHMIKNAVAFFAIFVFHLG